MTRILSLDEVCAALREFARDACDNGLEADLGLLEPEGLSATDVSNLEGALDCALPESFSRAIRERNFNRLQIGETTFGTQRTYFEELVWLNCETTWWCGSAWHFAEVSRTSPRPEHLLMIAGGDPYDWLLDTSNGRILGLDVEKLYPDAVPAAQDLEQFVRCRATSWIARLRSQPTEQLRAEILRVTKGDPGVWPT